jgi:hypothetical protein
MVVGIVTRTGATRHRLALGRQVFQYIKGVFSKVCLRHPRPSIVKTTRFLDFCGVFGSYPQKLKVLRIGQWVKPLAQNSNRELSSDANRGLPNGNPLQACFRHERRFDLVSFPA